MRRSLAETIVNLADAMHPQGPAGAMVRVTELSMSVPIEVALRRVGDEFEVLGDLPRWRWKTGFDETPGQMALAFMEGEPS